MVNDMESDWPTRSMKLAVHIHKEGQQAINWDEGSCLLNHAYDRFLDMPRLRRTEYQLLRKVSDRDRNIETLM